MTDDLGDSLSTIRGRHQQPLVTLLRDIQDAKIQNLKPTDYVQDLECLCFSTQEEFSDSRAWSTRPNGTLRSHTFTRGSIDAFQEQDYVAVSYTWDDPLLPKETCGKYYVRSRDGMFLQSQVRDSVFERASKYMAHFNLCHLWIDRECIVQENSKEKETALQAMDLVYYCSSHPIGLLSRPVISIEELKLLAALMEWAFVGQFGSEVMSSSRLPGGSPCRTLKLLEAIVGDTWWTRAWTYQENYRGGTDMKLLIPHCIPSEDYCDDYVEYFGDVPGEIILNSADFHEAATAFCLAFDAPAELMGARSLVLERARRFTLLLEKPDLNGRDLATRSMSPLIIADIEKRKLKLPLDRLPIIANCCQYSTRLDSTELAKGGHSVSLSILALFLLNGEILDNGPDADVYVSGANNITDFLNAQAFNRYSPPELARGLTYNKSCRFINVELTEDGIKTKGHLWKLGRDIDTSEFTQPLPYVEDGGRLGRNERRHLGLLANELINGGCGGTYRPLYEDIREYLRETPRHRNSFAKEYQDSMAEELATAVIKGGLLRLGCLWSPPGKHSPYRGIFVYNQRGSDGSSDYVFTASREREAHNDRYLPNDIDRHVSLEVDCTFGNGQLPFLRTRRWINGLCFFYRCQRRDVIFPWPSCIQGI
ncbi:heterokaryon incompatibility protein-domain-containing protein [Nemania abortiva]|nr:heterokaryon incompatibility protein-domain-containing protein [Nemania abortiva]